MPSKIYSIAFCIIGSFGLLIGGCDYRSDKDDVAVDQSRPGLLSPMVWKMVNTNETGKTIAASHYYVVRFNIDSTYEISEVKNLEQRNLGKRSYELDAERNILIFHNIDLSSEATLSEVDRSNDRTREATFIIEGMGKSSTLTIKYNDDIVEVYEPFTEMIDPTKKTY